MQRKGDLQNPLPFSKILNPKPARRFEFYRSFYLSLSQIPGLSPTILGSGFSCPSFLANNSGDNSKSRVHAKCKPSTVHRFTRLGPDESGHLQPTVR
jgi:hypothetical protein